MITFTKGMYPELTREDFDSHIAPILSRIGEYSAKAPSPAQRIDVRLDAEEYPFHLPCKVIGTNAWQEAWDASLDESLHDPIAFWDASCEQLSQLASIHLLRAFAQDVKKNDEPSDTPRQRYLGYEQKLIETQFRNFVAAYPIGWGRCGHLLSMRAAALTEVVRDVTHHRAELERTLGIPAEARITSVESSGDTHNGGKAVSVVSFEGGYRVIHKPRPVGGEAGYAKLAATLGPLLDHPLPAMRVLDLGHMGFTSYVEASGVADHQRAGGLACLMYVLDATDMHYTNIFWSPEGPLPIDLESLFHPARVRIGKEESSLSAYRALQRSVYGTGVLPMVVTSPTHKGSLDVGFTGTRDRQGSGPFRLFEIVDPFTSDIRVVWRRSEPDADLVNDHAATAVVLEAAQHLVNGFSEMYRWILEHRAFFVEAVLASFEGAVLRYIHNPTIKYVQLLRSLSGPEAAQNVALAHGLLSRIAILSVSSDPGIIEAECQQLWAGDIPYFTTRFGTAGLYAQDTLVSRLASSPRHAFLSKMDDLGSTDLQTQVRLIQLAFVAKLADPHASGQFVDDAAADPVTGLASRTGSSAPHRGALSTSLRELSNSLVDRLLDDRFDHLPRTWIGPVAQFGSREWSPGVLGYDLYGGRVGPALALATAGRVLGDVTLSTAAAQVFDRTAAILHQQVYELRNVLASGAGGFSGVPGMLWALHAAGLVTGNPLWCRVADNSWPLLNDSLADVSAGFFDMVTGNSSAIVMRLRTTGVLGADELAVDRWVQAGRARVLDLGHGLTSGLAHGVGQLLWFFGAISPSVSTPQLRGFTGELMDLLNGEYRSNRGLFQLYRDREDKVSSSWCNGIAGLLMALHSAFRAGLVPGDAVQDAVGQLGSVPQGVLPVLCHGSLGTTEVLRLVEEDFPSDAGAIRRRLEETTCAPHAIAAYFRQESGRYALSPGLMSGRAGAVLHLCARLEPQLTPSPATLTLPRSK